MSACAREGAASLWQLHGNQVDGQAPLDQQCISCLASSKHDVMSCVREGARALLRLRGYQADGRALLNHGGRPGLPQPGLPIRLCALRAGRRRSGAPDPGAHPMPFRLSKCPPLQVQHLS